MNVLFYSRTCDQSSYLIQLMTNMNILQNFKLYCVDGNLDSLPPHIKEVPSLIVTGISQPLNTQNSFKWIETVRFMNQKNTIEMNKKIILSNMMKNAQMIGPLGYATTEMGGFSDNFAFTETDHAQAKSFFGYGSETENTIFTAPEQTKIGTSEQNKKISDFESIRKEQDKESGVLMKQGQLNAVIESEKDQIREQQFLNLPRSQQLRMQQMKQMGRF